MSYEYFTEDEINRGWDVPEEYLNNIIPTARVLDTLRQYYGLPIYILSSYRSPEYNRKVGGAKNSLHLVFNALDFTVANKSDIKLLYNKLVKWDEEHKFDFLSKSGTMGLGLYKYFIHLDTRGVLGRRSPARWVM
jgi:hypothetical protein